MDRDRTVDNSRFWSFRLRFANQEENKVVKTDTWVVFSGNRVHSSGKVEAVMPFHLAALIGTSARRQ